MQIKNDKFNQVNDCIIKWHYINTPIKRKIFWLDKKLLLLSIRHIFCIQWYKNGEVKNIESYISYEQ